MPVTHPAHEQVEDVPADVTDVLLWRMATKVIAAHQPHPERPTRCTSLLCTGQHYPCLPVRTAHRAQQISRRRPPVAAGAPKTATCRSAAPMSTQSDGRAPRQAFIDWYDATRTAITSARIIPPSWSLHPNPSLVGPTRVTGRALVPGRGSRPPSAALVVGT
ncbi:hypothetical protein [Polymorphospora rubra]|uniref:Uncharacterized protein n=1 Tax=Polymorphospora rubra TaxID=338584 RepID=A0A810MYZ7_9ACTN|nr:hypothetical protein [Polymorphospora rubra]BCJ64803.1 hypothetical protein Prubr_18240 [Polymorphospora rubra]